MPRTEAALHSLAVPGATIEYSDTGGPHEAILLVHAGVFAAWFSPLAIEPALDGFRVIRMVRAGYTRGPTPAQHVTITDHAAHCAALLEHLDIAPAHILAHSSGSVIALQLTLDRPELVASLVLSEPALLDQLVDPQDQELLRTTVGPAIGGALAAAAGGDHAAAFERFMTALCGPDYPDVLRAALGDDGLVRAEQDSGFFFADEIPAAGEWQLDHQRTTDIHQPVLLVQGAASPPPQHRLNARLAAMISGAEIATIADGNHLLPLRNPLALAELTSEFLHRHPIVATV